MAWASDRVQPFSCAGAIGNFGPTLECDMRRWPEPEPASAHVEMSNWFASRFTCGFSRTTAARPTAARRPRASARRPAAPVHRDQSVTSPFPNGAGQDADCGVITQLCDNSLPMTIPGDGNGSLSVCHPGWGPPRPSTPGPVALAEPTRRRGAAAGAGRVPTWRRVHLGGVGPGRPAERGGHGEDPPGESAPPGSACPSCSPPANLSLLLVHFSVV